MGKFKKPTSSGKRYTTREQKIIIRCVEESPANLSHGFDEAAKLLPKRTSTAISVYWHTSLKKKAGLVLGTGSRLGLTKNVKNVFRDESGNIPTQDLSKGRNLELLEKMLNLPPQERRIAFQMYKNDR